MILASGPFSSVIQKTPTGRHLDQAAREGRLVEQDQRVERVAVLGQGVGDEPVVGRVERGREEPPVQSDHVALVVVLVLVAAPPGDLDDDVDGAVRAHGPRLSSDAGRLLAIVTCPIARSWRPPDQVRTDRPRPRRSRWGRLLSLADERRDRRADAERQPRTAPSPGSSPASSPTSTSTTACSTWSPTRTIPLLERVKFLILFSERIDEFFQVQVAGLRRQVVAGIKSLALNGSTPDQLLRDVRASLERMVRRQEHLLLDEIVPALAAEGIELCDWDDLDGSDRTYLHEVFDRLILPVVTPLTVDPSHPFPYISNLSLNVGVEVRSRPDEHLAVRPGEGPAQRRPAAAPARRATASSPSSRSWSRSSTSSSRAWTSASPASSGSPATPTWPSTTTPPTISSSPSRRSCAVAASFRSSGSRSTPAPRTARSSV